LISDGFLIAEGHVDQGREGGYWIAPRLAFDNTLMVRADKGKIHADFFKLTASADVDVTDFRERVEVKGANIQYAIGEGHVGFMHLNLKDSANATRDGMKVDDVRALKIPVPGIPELKFSTEYVTQSRGDTDGRAWYLGGTYKFEDVPLQPSLSYRYSDFSKHFDSLLYGYGGEWGTWTQGEIVGMYMLFNMNQRTSQYKIAVHPTDSLSTGAIFYQFNFADKPEGVSSSKFAKELDVFADWAVSPHLNMSAVAGVAMPDRGAKDYFGTGSVSHLAEFVAVYSF